MKLDMDKRVEARRILENEFDDPDSIAFELVSLRGFAADIMDCWPEGGIDGGDLQQIAVRHGILRPETRHEPCDEDPGRCSCLEYGGREGFPLTCYRRDYVTPNAELSGR